jgi:REP element-mobilizing transposase RayT
MVKRSKQLELAFPNTHGGARKGAGRKPNGAKPLVSHEKREEIDARHPVLVTMKLAPGFRSLRLCPEYRIVRGALADVRNAHGSRLIAFLVQTNHVHLMVEVASREALTSWAIALTTRLGRRLNAEWGHDGPIFADRCHYRALKTPREVHNAWRYVLLNHHRHGLFSLTLVDRCSSAPACVHIIGVELDGLDLAGLSPPVVAPATWLARTGCWRYGPIGARDIPGPRR